MNAVATPARKAPTQPLGWDWVNDWIALDTSLRDLERQHCWNWKRELTELEQDIDRMAAP